MGINGKLKVHEAVKIEHVLKDVTRKTYTPPIITHLKSGKIEGGQTTNVLEATNGLLITS